MPLVIQSDRGYSERLDGLCLTSYYVEFGLPCSLLGLILTLVAALSNQCSRCGTCCCLCCREPFEFGALVTSSPYIPYILGPDGQLVREGEADTAEMDIVPTKTEEDKVIVKEENVGDQLELSVANYGFINDNDDG